MGGEGDGGNVGDWGKALIFDSLHLFLYLEAFGLVLRFPYGAFPVYTCSDLELLAIKGGRGLLVFAGFVFFVLQLSTISWVCTFVLKIFFFLFFPFFSFLLLGVSSVFRFFFTLFFSFLSSGVPCYTITFFRISFLNGKKSGASLLLSPEGHPPFRCSPKRTSEVMGHTIKENLYL